MQNSNHNNKHNQKSNKEQQPSYHASNTKKRMKVCIPDSQQYHNHNQLQNPSDIVSDFSSISYYPGKDFNDSKIKIISKGKGINEKECNTITSICIEIKNSKISPPLSIKCVNKIKEKIGGEWLVFVCSENEKNYDFYLSYVKGAKYLIFSYAGYEFHVCDIH